MTAPPSACSKQMKRGWCKRDVVFWAEFHGRRTNACAGHLGDILIEHQVRPASTVTVRVRAALSASAEPERGSDD